MDMKTCTGCQKNLKLSEFARKLDRRQSRCKKCYSQYTRAHYKANKQYYKDKAHNHQKKLKKIVRDIKSSPCLDCGKQYPYYVMDFDHLADKKDNIANLVRRGASFKTVKEEITKCEIVCSNCHRMRTHHRLSQQ